jgi:hypothetical protein
MIDLANQCGSREGRNRFLVRYLDMLCIAANRATERGVGFSVYGDGVFYDGTPSGLPVLSGREQFGFGSISDWRLASSLDQGQAGGAIMAP